MVAIKEFLTVHPIASKACSYRNRYELSDGISNPVIPESADPPAAENLKEAFSGGAQPRPYFYKSYGFLEKEVTGNPWKQCVNSCLVKISNYSLAKRVLMYAFATKEITP